LNGFKIELFISKWMLRQEVRVLVYGKLSARLRHRANSEWAMAALKIASVWKKSPKRRLTAGL
jgi:hypothetical protein